MVNGAADRGTVGEPCSQRLDSCAAVCARTEISKFTVDNSSAVRQTIYTYVDNIVYASSEVTNQCSSAKISQAGIRSPPHSQATNHSGADGASRFPSIFPSYLHLRGCSLTWNMAPGLGPGCCRFKSCHSHSKRPASSARRHSTKVVLPPVKRKGKVRFLRAALNGPVAQSGRAPAF
jgi:hypothetical protein